MARYYLPIKLSQSEIQDEYYSYLDSDKMGLLPFFVPVGEMKKVDNIHISQIVNRISARAQIERFDSLDPTYLAQQCAGQAGISCIDGLGDQDGFFDDSSVHDFTLTHNVFVSGGTHLDHDHAWANWNKLNHGHQTLKIGLSQYSSAMLFDAVYRAYEAFPNEPRRAAIVATAVAISSKLGEGLRLSPEEAIKLEKETRVAATSASGSGAAIDAVRTIINNHIDTHAVGDTEALKARAGELLKSDGAPLLDKLRGSMGVSAEPAPVAAAKPVAAESTPRTELPKNTPPKSPLGTWLGV